MARIALQLRGVEPVEDEDNDDVAEGIETERGVRAKLRGVEHDLGLYRVPGIIEWLGTPAADMAYGDDVERHWKIGTAPGSWMTGGGRSMVTVAGSTFGPRSRK